MCLTRSFFYFFTFELNRPSNYIQNLERWRKHDGDRHNNNNVLTMLLLINENCFTKKIGKKNKKEIFAICTFAQHYKTRPFYFTRPQLTIHPLFQQFFFNKIINCEVQSRTKYLFTAQPSNSIPPNLSLSAP